MCDNRQEAVIVLFEGGPRAPLTMLRDVSISMHNKVISSTSLFLQSPLDHVKGNKNTPFPSEEVDEACIWVVKIQRGVCMEK
jgi:hypothetical protein